MYISGTYEVAYVKFYKAIPKTGKLRYKSG